ncbi:MAG: hypothetical protein IBX56_02065 [Methylomicrobium sp.]|nr:hypothetical protein [Methylomicrobium sp.]
MNDEGVAPTAAGSLCGSDPLIAIVEVETTEKRTTVSKSQRQSPEKNG